MFWKILSGLTRTTIAINKSVTALGLALVIGVGVYDFMKKRKQDEQRRLR
jgi:uncharacterized protein HemX